MYFAEVYNRYLELKKGSSAAAEVWGKELNKTATTSKKEEVPKPKNSSTMISMGKKLLERTSFSSVSKYFSDILVIYYIFFIIFVFFALLDKPLA